MIARRASTIATAGGGAPALLLVVALGAGAVSCTKNDSLVLLDLRSSGPLGAPVARVRLSAKGWPTRVVTGDLGTDGFRVGYYGPGNGGAVSVTAEALDDVDCVLGGGSATVAKLASGGTSDPVTLFIRPLPENDCVPDAGTMDDGGGDDGGDDGGMDAGDDTAVDAGVDGAADASDDTAADAGADVATDSAADAMAEDATADADLDASADAGD